jgi:hypothetical protein
MAYTLKRAMLYRGTKEVDHYLDNYITMCPPNSLTRDRNFNIMLDTCGLLGFNTNPSKVTTPNTVIEFLGLIIDSDKQEIRLSNDCANDIMEELHALKNLKTSTKRELLSFISRIINLSKRIKYLHTKWSLTSRVVMTSNGGYYFYLY